MKKVTEEELQRIQQLRESFEVLTKNISMTILEERDLEKELKKIRDQRELFLLDYDKLQDTETNLLNEIVTKYGAGQLNIETGEYME